MRIASHRACLTMKFIDRDLKALTLLSIIIPVSLLVSFRFAGILPEPPTGIAETLTLETVEWEFERPADDLGIREKAASFYRSDKSSVNVSINFGHYQEKMSHYGGDDVLDIIVSLVAHIESGFVNDIQIAFREYYERSQVRLPSPELYPVDYKSMKNLTIENWGYCFDRWWLLPNNTKAFIKANGVNTPSNVYFSVPFHWILRSQNNQSHQAEITSETSYYNGTVYKRVVQSFRLKLAPDSYNSFDTALEIQNETYSKLYLGGYDAKDYFKTYLIQGQRIDVHVNATFLSLSLSTPDLDLYLYDPTGNLRASPTDQRDYHKTISFVADITGHWYIETRAYENDGFYSITVEVH